jgi:hypothetical protein
MANINMMRIISLIKACCGSAPDDVSERPMERKTSHIKAPPHDVLILKSSSRNLPDASGNLPDANFVVQGAVEPEAKQKKKRKRRVKKPAERVVETKLNAPVLVRLDDSTFEAMKESQVEEKKVQPKPLKGILKNKGR